MACDASMTLSSVFQVDDFELEGQHIREYAGATAHRQEDISRLAIKRYTPLSNLNASSGDITVIAAHANGVSVVSIVFQADSGARFKSSTNPCGRRFVIN